MDWNIFSLVIAAAVFHAVWNFAAKKSRANKICLLWLALFSAGLILGPIGIALTDVSAISNRGWQLILLSSLTHAFYIYLLGKSYEIGQISSVYPIMRGSGIAGTAMLAAALAIDDLSVVGISGIVLIILGSCSIGLKEFPDRSTRPAFLVALMVGVTISGYSIIDKLAVSHVHPLFYVCAVNLASTILLLPLLLHRHQAAFAATIRNHKMEGTMLGIAGLLTYLIILYAYRSSPASYVVALRETSIVVAAFLGIKFLKDDFSKRKMAGIILIVCGAVVIKAA